MKHTKTFKDIAKAGVLGSILAFGLSSCDMGGNTNAQNIQKQGATVFIEKNNDGSYSVADEFPSNETRVFLRETGIDGKVSERLLSQDEIDSLLAQANTMIDQNASGLTNASLSSGGLSLGEAILASAAGAIIGSWIGSKLFGSPTYQNTRQAAYKNPSAYSRSVNNFQNARSATSSSSKKSGFFSGGSKSSSGSSMGG